MSHAAQPLPAAARSTRDELIEVIWDGVVAGLVGYATVAIVAGMLDVVLGRSFFFTASMLGQSLFQGLVDPARVVVTPGSVLAYNGLHLVGCLAIAAAAAWLAYMAEQGPELWYVGLVLFLMVALGALGAVLLITEPVRAAMPVWQVVVPTFAGVTAVLVTLYRERPALRRELGTWRD